MGVLGWTLAGFSHGPGFYRTDEQGQMFDQYGRRIYGEGEEQTIEESSGEEEVGLGVRELPDVEDNEDDEDTPLKEIVERRHKLAE